MSDDVRFWRREAEHLQHAIQHQDYELASAYYRSLHDKYDFITDDESPEFHAMLSDAYAHMQELWELQNKDSLGSAIPGLWLKITSFFVIILVGVLLAAFFFGFFDHNDQYYCVADDDFVCSQVRVMVSEMTGESGQDSIWLSTLRPDAVFDVQLSEEADGTCTPISLLQDGGEYVVSLNCSKGLLGEVVEGFFGLRYITSDGVEKTTIITYRTKRSSSTQNIVSSQQPDVQNTSSSSSSSPNGTTQPTQNDPDAISFQPRRSGGSGGGGGGSSSRPVPADQTKPDLSVTVIPQEIAVDENFGIQALSQASDLASIVIRYAGETVKTCAASPCQYNTSSSQAASNSYTITATDAQGNEQIVTGTIIVGSSQSPEEPQFEQSDFVKVQDGVFTLDGQEFRFAGSNAYYLANYEKIQPSLVTQTLDEFERANLSVVRMWGSFDGDDCGYWDGDNVIQTAPGVYDEQALQDLDAVVAKGKERGLRFVIALVNYWDEHGGVCQYNTWAGAADPSRNMEFFLENSQTQQWYRDYIEMLLNRENTVTGVGYKDEPAIMAWEIMNEGHGISGGDPQVLADWYQDIAMYIKSIDQNHLVATGEEGFDDASLGSWQDGGFTHPNYTSSNYSNTYVLRAEQGTSYVLNTQIPEIDFGGAHWYPNHWGFGYAVNEQYLQAQEAWIADHVRIAQDAGKPFVLGEYGHEGGGGAEQLQAYEWLWQQVEDTPGAAGDLLWQYTTNYVKCWEYQGNICWPDGRADQELAEALWAHANAMFSGQSVPSSPSKPSDPASDQEAEIMLIGDSLTQAWQSRKGVNDVLVENGYLFDMVGSFTDNEWTDWDSDHQAVGGRSNTQIRNDIPSWSNTYQPQIINLMAGTNDIAWDQGMTATSAQEVADRYELLLAALQQAVPDVVIVASTIPPMSSQVVDTHGSDRQQTGIAYNAEIQQRVEERISQGEKLVFVDAYAQLSLDDLTDGVHLTEDGYNRLGRVWAQGIQEAYSLLDVASPPDSPSQDTTDPQVSVAHSPTSPAVSEQVMITVTASDDVQLTQIELFYDGVSVKTCASSPCGYTTAVSAGAHTYSATATDSSSNSASASDSFTALSDDIHSLGQDLVLYYQFTEGSGSLINDVSPMGQTHNAQIVGGGTWTTIGSEGVWRSEPGVADYFVISDHPEIDVADTQDFTLGVFFAYTENGNTWTKLFDKGYWPGFSINVAGWNDEVQFLTSDNSPSVDIPGLKDGDMHQLVAVYDQSAFTIDVYFDGSHVAQLSYDEGQSTNGGDAFVPSTGVEDFTASYNRLGLWNRQLSAAEVSEWYADKDVMLS